MNFNVGQTICCLLLVGVAMAAGAETKKGAGATLSDAEVAASTAVAVQQIEYLRRRYATATDLIGLNTAASIAEGRKTYHAIFTPDVVIRVKGEGVPAEDTTGPDAWVEVASNALERFAVTQHLIGTQLVDIDRIDFDGSGNVVAGEATMSSYLQAWHATPDNNVWLFLGTYHDKVRFVPGTGWRIYHVTLERVSGEERPMGVPGAPN